jgi:predicted alpha/beta-fold hydrolase
MLKQLYNNRHFATIIPSLFRKVEFSGFKRVEFKTWDNDFIHLDEIKNNKKRVVIILHGLEGSAKQHYVLSQAKSLSNAGYDIIAVNFRTCSGVMNKTTNLYHSGETKDLTSVIEYAQKSHEEIHIIGFSLGGNVLLKYLGETKTTAITSAAAFSAPISLESCAEELDLGFNKIYARHFMSTLSKKVVYIQNTYTNNKIMTVKPKELKSFFDFDHLVTAPLHGFESAKDYWDRSSSLQFLGDIKIPTLLMNAKDDPFLGQRCYPEVESINNPNLTFEYPEKGGHVGFTQDSLSSENLMDIRAKSFLVAHSRC